MEEENYIDYLPQTSSGKTSEADKIYTFNETGNIMLSRTIDGSKEIEESARKLFQEVSVFFAAMTRAISTTFNPSTGKRFSIYNFKALESVISGSGLFVQVTKQNVKYKITSVGAEFSTQLIENVLGLTTGSGVAKFASSMVAGIGQEAVTLKYEQAKKGVRVGNIIFVCEYLLGMPIVSAIVVSLDLKENKAEIKAGPCFNANRSITEWKIHKDTYLFVPPRFIKEYAGDLSSIQTDPEYIRLVNWLQELTLRRPVAYGIYTMEGEDAKRVEPGESLIKDQEYFINGNFLPQGGATLKFTDGNGKLTVGSSLPSSIKFTATETREEASTIEIWKNNGTVKVTTVPGAFAVKDPEVAEDLDRVVPEDSNTGSSSNTGANPSKGPSSKKDSSKGKDENSKK